MRQPEKVPCLIEILKKLDQHRHSIWERSQGVVQEKNRLDVELGKALRDLRKKIPGARYDDLPQHLQSKLRWLREEFEPSEDDLEAIEMHPLFFVSRWVEEYSGVPRADVESAAYRLHTAVGLAPLNSEVGAADLPDLRPAAREFARMDQDGRTSTLWNILQERFQPILSEAGLPTDSERMSLDAAHNGTAPGEPSSSSWLPADSPSRLAKKYQVSISTLKRREKKGLLRIMKVSSKSWRLHADDIGNI